MTVRRLPALVMSAALGVTGVVSLAAQDTAAPPASLKAEDIPPAAAPTPAGTGTSPANQPPAAAGADTAPSPGEIRMRAEHQEGEKGHYKARGFVDLRMGETRIQCDELDLVETDRPDGTKAQKIVAVGNVVFLRGEERLAGDRLEMDLESGLGVMVNASGFVQPGVFVEARRIERKGEKLYRIEGGTFTACAQPNPRWRFSLRSADLELEDKIIARSVVLRVKSVPLVWLPIIAYPLDSDQRSTGLLFPTYGSSQLKGKTIHTGFFWAMGRSFDQTLYADYFSKVGHGFGHEFRYAGERPSSATFSTYVYNPDDRDERDWDIQWNAVKLLPGRVKLSLKIKQYSNLTTQRLLQDSFNRSTTRTQRSEVALQKVFKVGTLQIEASRRDAYFSEDNTNRQEKLPSVSFNQYPKRLGGSGLVFGYKVFADSVGKGKLGSLETFSRFDVYPQLSRPFRASFVDVNPRMAFRYTRYSTTYVPNAEGINVLDGPARNRPLFETGVDLRGPTFSRVFLSPGGLYSDRLKHVIGPEVSWDFSSRVAHPETIPFYDFNDSLRGTSKISYAIVQQLFGRRKAENGKLYPYEFFSWRVRQTYYLTISDNQNDYDSNYSESGFAPGGTPAHRSVLDSGMRLRPRPGWAADFNLAYNVNYKQPEGLSLSTTVGGERASLQASWSRRLQLSETPEERTATSSLLGGAARLGRLPGGFSLEGGVQYNFARDELYHANAKLRWDVNCCGFEGEVVKRNWNGIDDFSWSFSFHLANVGSASSFTGTGAEQRQGVLGGQR